MYIPKYYQQHEMDAVESFIRENPFSILVSHDTARPISSHLMIEHAKTSGGEVELIGHMARANPQWRTLDPQREVLAIFHGPHTYVSPSWYDHSNVPTWNYIAVHVYGFPSIIEDMTELEHSMKKLMDRFETGAHSFESMPRENVEKQLRAIVGFRVRVTAIEAAFKLSQNRNPTDYERIIIELAGRGDQNSRLISNAMKAVRD